MIYVDETEPPEDSAEDPDWKLPTPNPLRSQDDKVTNHYELGEKLGSGRFGVVYRCKEQATGRVFAAKYVTTPKKSDRQDVEREVNIMRKLQHPRLLQLYEAYDDPGKKEMVLILELIEGGELFERVIDDDFVLTEKACSIFLRQICEGVDFMHAKNILHLDMKPENVLCLTRTGNRIKLIDFGLAREYDSKKPLRLLHGTPEFVAPEVVSYDEVGFGTDMWSVGVITYVLLSGLSPFMGESDNETLENVRIGKYDFDDDAFDEISEEAKDFINKLLVKDKRSRLTAKDCQHHTWLLTSKEKPLSENHKKNLRTYLDNKRKWMRGWNCLKALNRMGANWDRLRALGAPESP